MLSVISAGVIPPEISGIYAVQDLVRFAGTKVQGLPRGLYLAYLKLYSSLDRICIATPRHSPDMLPHVKIRDSANVTRSIIFIAFKYYLLYSDLTGHWSLYVLVSL